jgi:hypothetical protein
MLAAAAAAYGLDVFSFGLFRHACLHDKTLGRVREVREMRCREITPTRNESRAIILFS